MCITITVQNFYSISITFQSITSITFDYISNPGPYVGKLVVNYPRLADYSVESLPTVMYWFPLLSS